MKHQITFQWIDPCPNERLRLAQESLRESVIALGLKPLLYPAGPEMVKFADILRFARERCRGDSFVWCNSDVTLLRDPYEVGDGVNVHGFHRTEMPSGEVCGGVDMYLIPKAIWDGWLGVGLPDLWCGATHIDWWLTRAPALQGCYKSHFGYIDHLSHPASSASKGGNAIYRHNIREYNRWARRHGAGMFEELLDLPLVGKSVSPISDFVGMLQRLDAKP